MIRKIKYIAIFLDKVQSTYRIVKKKRFKPSDTDISYKDNTYSIDKGITGYSKKNKKINFFFDILTGQLSFYKVEGINPKLANLVLTSGIIRNITSGLTKKSNFDFNMILYLGIGGVIGFLLGFMF